MIGQVIEITSPVILKKDYGRLQIIQTGTLLQEIPFDQIETLILHPTAGTITTNVLIELTKRNIPVIITGENYHPQGMLLPIENHFHQTKILHTQIEVPEPVKKQIWKKIVQTKILMQANVLEKIDQKEANRLQHIASQTQSGDKTNTEAVAAKHYFEALYGKGFKRKDKEDPINAMLNYGYTIMRATIARALTSAGLTLNLGLFHHN